MRVAIVTESYLPDANGVSHSVQRVVEHLNRQGHQPLVVAPEPASNEPIQQQCVVVRVPSVPMPGYASFRIGLPSRKLEAALVAHRTDVVHLASPFALGAHGAFVAERLGLPSVAVYQTDVAGFAGFYRLGVGRAAAWRWLRRVHAAAGRTLAPSTPAVKDLRDHGVPRVHLWPRGVDGERFAPRHRSEPLHDTYAPGGELLVGYVGRLAPEKHLELLEPVTRMPGVRVVIVGDGPARKALENRMPTAVFRGELHGAELSAAYASLDLFVHTGAYETFCQSVQEALASGVPTVAPAAGGPLDLVRPGQTGLLVRPDDATAIEEAVGHLLHHRDQLTEFAAAARESVLHRTWSSINAALIEHYDAVRFGDQEVRAA
ncbi:glycosyltransferase family 4 protein [Fodinicola acaciae]|uniref:glycosyltransferase family 4 protein n=1 Tax=Fodinicola acaciae TaxID=2681555 RepID=UPI0013D79D12|nr:glycosyltransferase family 1 protein [Fodinicola acaciae]